MTNIKMTNIKIGTKVQDTWFKDWGIGVVKRKLKTIVHIEFSNEGMIKFDISHLQFLKKIP